MTVGVFYNTFLSCLLSLSPSRIIIITNILSFPPPPQNCTILNIISFIHTHKNDKLR